MSKTLPTTMDAPSALTEKALAGGPAPADVSRFSLKSSAIRSPPKPATALLSVGGSIVVASSLSDATDVPVALIAETR